MNDSDEQAFRVLMKRDLHRLRESASMPPSWRILRILRMRAARRVERRLRAAHFAAMLLLTLGALPLLREPRDLPGFVVPLLIGVLVCWRRYPGSG